jgi:hypothetical protein
VRVLVGVPGRHGVLHEHLLVAVLSTPTLVEMPASRIVSMPRRRSWRSSSVP